MPITINGSNTPIAGGITYGDGTAYATTPAGTAGQLLVSGGSGLPTWVSGSSLTVGQATQAVNLANGSQGTIPYQTGTVSNPSTAMVAAGGSGHILTYNSAQQKPQWNDPAGLTVGIATNVAGGSAGTLHYQSAANTTAMLAVGTAGQVLTSQGAAAPTWAAPAGGGQAFVAFGGG